MTCFFPMIGRFGNLLFIYAFARAFCEKHGYDLCLPPWIGECIFKIPLAVRPHGKPDRTMAEQTYQNQDSLIYTREQVRNWFQIRDDVLENLKPVLKNRKLVTLNCRGGQDYVGAGLVMISEESYYQAAKKEGYENGEIEFETDLEPTRLPQFTGDVSASGLCTTWVALPSFYKLMTANVLFRANSTFSWWAATLSNAKVFSPIIRGMRGGVPNQACEKFVEGNWPVMADNHPNTDLHLS